MVSIDETKIVRMGNDRGGEGGKKYLQVDFDVKNKNCGIQEEPQVISIILGDTKAWMTTNES